MSGQGSLATGGFEGEQTDPDILVPLEHHWLALCLCTESNRRREWPLIAQVIYNRVASPRYPDTAEGVILQRMQFSAFNPFTTKARVQWKPAYRFKMVFEGSAIDPLLFVYATDMAAQIVGLHDAEDTKTRISYDITPQTLHYWSPISMPKGKRPAWAPSASRLYTPPGIDPDRFVFAEGVP